MAHTYMRSEENDDEGTRIREMEDNYYDSESAYSQCTQVYDRSDLRPGSQQQNMEEIIVESPNIPNYATTQQVNHEAGEGDSVMKASCLLLYGAALRGDWKAAKTVLDTQPDIIRIGITERRDCVLHVAAAAKQTDFVRNLVQQYLKKEDLELQNKHGYTAFCFAAVSGAVEIAKVMYNKNSKLPTIQGKIKKTPLEMAILLGKRKMVEYLYPITPLRDLSPEQCMETLVATIHTDMYDIALKILLDGDTKVFTSPTTNKGHALQVLAQKSLSHNAGIHGLIWERLVSIVATIPYVPYFKGIHSSLQMQKHARDLVKRIWDEILKLPDTEILELVIKTQIFHNAAKIGNVEFLTLLTHSYPDLIWKLNSNGCSIFHIAVENRQEKVFSLIYHIGGIKDLIAILTDKDKNNILHLAAKLPPPDRLNVVSGAALQMQRELLWFQEVEKLVPKKLLEMRNAAGKTPMELFSRKHKKLQKEGEEWMQRTTNSCMLVATLIATVAFAAAFTVPGGNNQETGIPIFLKHGWYTTFSISNAVAMFSSATSIMMFLSILTSRYAQADFLFSLPAKLMFGLLFLFISIICLGLTFTAAFFLAYKENKGPLPGVVAALAFLPFIIYAVLNGRIWVALFPLTFFPNLVMFGAGKHRLY